MNADQCNLGSSTNGPENLSQTAHTPGPWVVIPRGESSGKCVGTVEPKPETMPTTNYWTVASVNGLRDEWEANLRLIAAAPDLLDALQRYVSKFGHCGPVHDAARAAIAKATGAA